MSKDPAILFYSSDFLTGTMIMSYDERGKYITLLCMQHQFGRLTSEHMFNICQRHDKHVISKFTIDENGLYYNERLENEILKRRNYSESRSKNRKNKNISSSYVQHMENENENTFISLTVFNNKYRANENFQTVSAICAKHYITPPILFLWLEAFCLDQEAASNKGDTFPNLCRHFKNWLNKQNNIKTPPMPVGKTKEITDKDRW